MADWRIGRGWTERELRTRLDALPALERNFSDPVERMTAERGWHRYASEAAVAREAPGPPVDSGQFARGRIALASYAFSDPRIVIAHFDPAVPLAHRRFLLEMRAMRILRYLGGAVVGAVFNESEPGKTVFGFRYETLEGHIEAGVEHFLLTKAHATGEIRFRIEATWRPATFPNWWSRVGFALLGKLYQETWHRRAHRILARLVRDPEVRSPRHAPGRLAHADPKVVFTRTGASNARR